MEKGASTSKSSSSTPPTTFVQTDPATFRELVQRLTSGDVASPAAVPTPKVSGSKRPTAKLHERRQYMVRPKLDITKPAVRSSTRADFLNLASPSGNFSRLSIVDGETWEPQPAAESDKDEERAIKEKGFYLHPSPVFRRGNSEPALLNLFPLSP